MTELTDEDLEAIRWRATDHVTDRHCDRDTLLAEVDRLRRSIAIGKKANDMSMAACDEARKQAVEEWEHNGFDDYHAPGWVKRYREELENA